MRPSTSKAGDITTKATRARRGTAAIHAAARAATANIVKKSMTAIGYLVADDVSQRTQRCHYERVRKILASK